MIRISNKSQLAISTERKLLLDIVEQSFSQLFPLNFLSSKIKYQDNNLIINNRSYNLAHFENIFLIGFGKSSSLMAKYLETILIDRIKKGFIISNYDAGLIKCEYVSGEHPFPSNNNQRATKKIVALAKDVKDNDLVLFLISGGGSAFLVDPILKLEKYKRVMEVLFSSGADIHEINTIRKHLSHVKGGNLAKLFFPATCVSIIFSDVSDNNFSDIASGPTVLDKTTIEEAENISSRYGLGEIKFIETPKDVSLFKKHSYFIIQDRHDLAQKVNKVCLDKKISSRVLSNKIKGVAREEGIKLIKNALDSDQILIGSGETVVNLVSYGKGGRNQEMCLSVLDYIGKSKKKYVFLAINTDGIEGNSTAAGGIVDKHTIELAKEKSLSWIKYLNSNDSFNFLQQTDSVIITGKTGINLADLYLIYRYS